MIILENENKAKFDTRNTNMSYYNDFLKPSEVEYYKKNKNRVGEIVQMSPKEYFEHCAKDVFNVPVDNLIKSRQDSFTPKYKEAMLNGDVFPMCVLNIADSSQEGLHRMLAAAELFGWDVKYPVLVVSVYDEDVENLWKFRQEMYSYFGSGFKHDSNEVFDKLMMLPGLEPPIDILTQATDIMKEVTNGDIEITADFRDDRGNIKLRLIPYKYKGVEVEEYCDPIMESQETFLENLFDIPDDFDPDIYF